MPATIVEARPVRRGVLFWVLLALVVALGVAAFIGMQGWNRAIDRADAATGQATNLRAAAGQADANQRALAAAQAELGQARERVQALTAQLAAATAKAAAPDDAALASANARADAATKAAADADTARKAAEARVAELERAPAAASPRAAASPPAQQGASNILAANDPPRIAPALPLPGLAPDARPRDYLVAAQQALRAGDTGRAQAALERAETRMLNRDSANGTYTPGRHPGVAEIEAALDQLGRQDTPAALAIVERLLVQP